MKYLPQILISSKTEKVSGVIELKSVYPSFSLLIDSHLQLSSNLILIHFQRKRGEPDAWARICQGIARNYTDEEGNPAEESESTLSSQ